jgi:zinc transporter 1/2/3
MFGNACLGELAFEPAAPAISLAALIIILCARLDFCVSASPSLTVHPPSFLSSAFDFVFMRMINARARRATAGDAAESSSSSEDGISPNDHEKQVGPALPDNHTHSHHHATDVDFSSPQAHMDVTSEHPRLLIVVKSRR